jgi:hypothetical protein
MSQRQDVTTAADDAVDEGAQCIVDLGQLVREEPEGEGLVHYAKSVLIMTIAQAEVVRRTCTVW